MWNLHFPVYSSDLVYQFDLRRQSTVNAQYLVVDQGS